MGTKSAYGSLNFGFSYSFSEIVSVLIGYDLFFQRNLPDTFTFQVDIDIL